jgi:copper(I)-binding protein
MITLALGLALATTPPPPAPTPPSTPPAVTTTAPAAALVVEGAWIRQPPPGAKMLGGYVRLKNPGTTAVKVVAAQTSLSPRAELHTHLKIDGMMKMRQVPFIEVPAGGEAVLEPGGLHLMAMQLPAVPKEGDVVDVTLTLEDGRTVAFKAPVQKEAPPKEAAKPTSPPPAPAPSGW